MLLATVRATLLSGTATQAQLLADNVADQLEFGSSLRITDRVRISRPGEPISTATGNVLSRTTVTTRGEAVTVIAPLDEIQRELVLLGAAVVLTIFVLSALVVAVLWAAIGRALRPVERIRATVADITSRDLTRRVPEPATRDEIGRLAVTMNSTLERLDRALRQQRSFVADASHELRSPLAALRTELEFALNDPGRPDWRAAIREALHDAGRLERLAADLLLLARADAEEPTRHVPIDLSALVARQSARRAMVSTRLVPAVVHGNTVQLERLITNLLDNAERHARTQITVRLSAGHGQVVLEVADDGPGIPEEDRDRVFERFTRLDNARNREVGGAGLGLAIAKAIATGRNGTLCVTDAQPGACFILRLPRTSTDASAAGASPDRCSPGRG
ncbi:HAMP domain-containing sensor histidine kinase [Spongiactinospora sp. TRM90649]|uniref:sensor histidine kinase n=1 Tax=Spongiactinospora sp. TRM90649 TaxID=3031114 RepID=UPI0023F7DBBD|nr:HAMP domain-containing sensor histidine kinase [Spongiactinospora sp. TRM90649]MDF5758172.1 HAMP domain-containing sensor histidine kinase [Spongiactinospora sp. TRM90649]